MKIMARGMRQLSQQVTDPAKQQDTLTLIGKLRKAATDSKALDPRMTATVPPADKEKFLTAYRAEMDKLNDAFGKIEDAVKSGQYDQAKALLPSIKSIQGEGHRQFKED
jgi:soluble cytochrome b562